MKIFTINSIPSFMHILSMGFNPKGAGDTQAMLQFDFSGTIEGRGHFTLNNGSIAYSDGPAEEADLIIKTPFDVRIDIMSGNADGVEMMVQGKYTAEGDTDLLIKMGEWFGQ